MRRSGTRAAFTVALLVATATTLGRPTTAAAEQLLRNQDRGVRLGRLVDGMLPPDGVLLFGLGLERDGIQVGPADARYNVQVRTLRMDLEYGWRPWLRSWASLPYRSWNGGGVDLPTGESGLADGEAGLVVGLPRPWRSAGLAIDARSSLPFGSRAKGLGDGAAAPYLGLAFTQRFWRTAQAPELRLHANVGRRWTPRDAGRGRADAGLFEPWPGIYPAVAPGAGSGANDPLVWGVGMDIRKSLVDLAVTYRAEVYPRDALISAREANRSLTASVRWGSEAGWALDVAYDVPLPREDLSTPYVAAVPDWVMMIGLSHGFSLGGSDRDHDGVVDRLDLCPDAPEDRDGFRDDDGCPDPDNDEDGVPDVVDKAPDLPEDIDGWKDQDGVPDPDNDGDGILDVDDKCPNEAEDFDGDRDDDGCPDVFLDRDGDGIADDRDGCPDLAEDRDGFEDDDGCPDLDNDLDGIPDDRDACPDLAEDYDGDQDDDGCPDPMPPADAPGIAPADSTGRVITVPPGGAPADSTGGRTGAAASGGRKSAAGSGG